MRLRNENLQGDLMLHTDRGVEYRGHVYQTALKRQGILHIA